MGKGLGATRFDAGALVAPMVGLLVALGAVEVGVAVAVRRATCVATGLGAAAVAVGAGALLDLMMK